MNQLVFTPQPSSSHHPEAWWYSGMVPLSISEPSVVQTQLLLLFEKLTLERLLHFSQLPTCADNKYVFMALLLFFTAPIEEVILLGFIFCFLCAMARVNLQLFLFLIYSSDLLMVALRMSQALCYVSLRFFSPLSLHLFLSGPLGHLLECEADRQCHEWWMMTGGLSGANRMHNTACRQWFLPSALSTCCSYCIISVEDLPWAHNCDRLKWKPPKPAFRYVCTYCV